MYELQLHIGVKVVGLLFDFITEPSLYQVGDVNPHILNEGLVTITKVLCGIIPPISSNTLVIDFSI